MKRIWLVTTGGTIASRHVAASDEVVTTTHEHPGLTAPLEELARELDKRARAAGRPVLPVLLEVNAGIEAQKGGVPASEVCALVDVVRALPGLELRGLMTMPPFGDLAIARKVFEDLVHLRDALGGAAALPELSMGMSDDLDLAVAAGATLVRVGTAIFGARGA